MNTDFATRLLAWFDQYGRQDLPWQHPREPYRVWLSEIMLQQTQVTTVIGYFQRFIERFPTLASLAAAPVDDVLALWSGLGYYARARNLHRCAQQVVAEHGGELPKTIDELSALPGIGRSTAGAILAQAHGMREAILDGNVRRVLSRHAAIAGWPGENAVQQKLWAISIERLPQQRLADYTQALMDLGATLCTSRKPRCGDCPVSGDCVAYAQGTVAQFPQPKPKQRSRPQRSVRVLLAHNADGALLLERRPPVGIWGGLWCPPLVDDAKLASGSWAEMLLSSARRQETLPALQHAFTHFDLTLQPVRLQCDLPPQIGEAGPRWVTLDELSALGLPAPIKKLLDQVER